MTGDLRSVYFIQAGGPNGPIKIGVASDVAARMADLQGANAQPLRLLAIVQAAGQELERKLHARFATGRLKGEWFAADTPGLRGYIRSEAITRRASMMLDPVEGELQRIATPWPADREIGDQMRIIELADELSVSPRTVHRWLVRHALPLYSVGTRLVVSRTDFARFLDAHTTSSRREETPLA